MKYLKNKDKLLAKMWTDHVPVEEDALRQITQIAELPFIFRNGVAVMPDCHVGKGATVGTVLPTTKAIVPAAVGVDIGCVDADTEFLTLNGWKRICDYEEGDEVLQSDTQGNAQFVLPQRYIKKKSKGFLHFRTKYGVDQMLSHDHKVLCWKITGRDRRRVVTTMSALELADRHGSLVQGAKVEFKTSFYRTDFDNTGVFSLLGLNEDRLRVQVMLMADGHLIKGGPRVVVKFKKDRKIERAEFLLTRAGINYTKNKQSDGCVTFNFRAPLATKTYSGWISKCDGKDLEIIADECLYWDGSEKEQCFYTRDKASADFIQYAFSCLGNRARIRQDLHKDGGIDYRVFVHTNTDMVGLGGSPKSEIKRVESPDGFEYCFTVPSGFWVMRRNGSIVITGNCGMEARPTPLFAKDLPDSLSSLRSTLEERVPHGFDPKGRTDQWAGKRWSWKLVHEAFWEQWFGPLMSQDTSDKALISFRNRVNARAKSQLGSLGGGNHFIELCLDETERVWVMLHSGSRGLGNKVGRDYIAKAKKIMEQFYIELPDSDLAYLPEGHQEFRQYIYAVHQSQRYADLNRKYMMAIVMRTLEEAFGTPERPVSGMSEESVVSCHHNYISKETHFGQKMWITRKGAVSANKGEMGIIPGSMGAKSFIVEGKGNEESYCSCSHGAGRVMSRRAARELITVEEHEKDTKGVECRKDASVIDESPRAYKNIDDVMKSQEDLVEIKHTLKQILCIKG